jgi:hypothetical protein
MSAIIRGGTSGTDADVDANKGLLTVANLPAHPAAGGFYTACGGPAGIVAAGLATDTCLMAMRFSASSTRRAFLSKFRFLMSPATLGAAGGVAGSIGLQRFTTATPSGGTTRTANELSEPLATATDMTSIQDLASALTVTSVVFGAEVARTRVPLFVSSAGWFEWIFEPAYPVVLVPGDGLVLRTRVALAATQTWVFDWTAHWSEGPAVS